MTWRINLPGGDSDRKCGPASPRERGRPRPRGSSDADEGVRAPREEESILVSLVGPRERIAHELDAKEVLVLEHVHHSRDDVASIAGFEGGVVDRDRLLDAGSRMGPVG